MRVERVAIVILSLTVAFLAGRTSVAFPVAAQPSGIFARFSFSGYHHGGGVTVDASGHGMERYRTYGNCNQTILTACDQFIGSNIYAGGFVEFVLKRTAGNKAYGAITDSSLSWEVGATVTLVLAANDTMTVYIPSSHYINCGPKAPVFTCGA